MEKVTLSIITVNHNSSALLKDCFFSVVSAVGNEPYEFLVVDSGSRDEDLANLRNLKGGNIGIIANRENIGYARAVNMGIRNAKGDYVLITNPDVIYKSDSIAILLDALRKFPRCGAVGPRTWWNREMSFLLPASEPITPGRIFKSEFMSVSRAANDLVLGGWIRNNLRYWLSEEPVKQEMLSGACILTSRKILDAVGGFDEIFPLYFEDTDWCLRLVKKGYQLYMVPQARIVHYYNQSAKQDVEASRGKYDFSSAEFLKKHFRGRYLLLRGALRLHKAIGHRVSGTYDDKGVFTSPPVLSFESRSRKLLLLSPVASMIPSAGSFFEGNSFEAPKDLWGCLGDGRYYVKVIDLDSFRTCAAWSWVKQRSTPAVVEGRQAL
jgi:N-acetylglucosaminyl-diphospho-decaprenol L-rhamnosyltransferase